MPPKSAAKSTGSNSQELNLKQKDIFAKVVGHYDNKNYASALKEAEVILKAVPHHAETLCLKGGSQYHLLKPDATEEEKKQCFDLIQKGVMSNPKSAICWHLQGLCYRNENNLTEAIKSLAMAFKINPDNFNIGRDLSVCQMQMHNYPAFTETRRKIFYAKPTRYNCLQLVTGLHLSGNYKEAVKIIDTFLSSYTPEDTTHNTRYEDAEVHFYRVQILMEGGDHAEAYDYLMKNESLFVDIVAFQTRRAALLEKLNRLPEAEECYRWLINTTSENDDYHTGLRNSLSLSFTASEVIAKYPAGILAPENATPISSEKLAGLVTLYTDLQKQYPKSNAAKRIPLNFLQGNDFEVAVDAYVRPKLASGVPSLFSDVRSLYADDAKREIVERMTLAFLTNLETSGKFSPEDEVVAKKDALLWTNSFLASHFDYLGETEKALMYVDAAISQAQAKADENKKNYEQAVEAAAAIAAAATVPEVSEATPEVETETESKTEPKEITEIPPAEIPPALIDNLMLKAYIIKHAGDALSAHQTMNASRRSDLFDRYLNTRCTRFALQAGRDKIAESTVFLFLRDNDSITSLHTNQAIWFELQQALCYMDRKEYALAHQKFSNVEKTYQDYCEEFSDFHGYQARKGTMRTYAAMVRFHNKIRGHKFYVRAASAHIELLLDYIKVQQKEQNELIAAACAEAKLSVADISSFTEEQKAAYDTSLALLKENRAIARKQSRATAEVIYREYIDNLNAENDCKPVRTLAQQEKTMNPDPLGLGAIETLNPLTVIASLLAPLVKQNGNSISTTILAVRAYLALGDLKKAEDMLTRATNGLTKYTTQARDTVHALPAVHFHPTSFALHGVPIGIKRVIVPLLQAAETYVLSVLVEMAKSETDTNVLIETNEKYILENVNDIKKSFVERLVNAIAAAKVTIQLGNRTAVKDIFALLDEETPISASLRAPLRSALLFLKDAVVDVKGTGAEVLSETAEKVRAFGRRAFPRDMAFLTSEELSILDITTQVVKPVYATDAANPPKPKTEEEIKAEEEKKEKEAAAAAAAAEAAAKAKGKGKTLPPPKGPQRKRR